MKMENIYTTAEASEYLKVSEITIRRYIRDGKLESKKIGRYHRITEKSIKAFLEAQGKPREGSNGHE